VKEPSKKLRLSVSAQTLLCDLLDGWLATKSPSGELWTLVSPRPGRKPLSHIPIGNVVVLQLLNAGMVEVIKNGAQCRLTYDGAEYAIYH
jgi:hypothetical protein